MGMLADAGHLFTTLFAVPFLIFQVVGLLGSGGIDFRGIPAVVVGLGNVFRWFRVVAVRGFLPEGIQLHRRLLLRWTWFRMIQL